MSREFRLRTLHYRRIVWSAAPPASFQVVVNQALQQRATIATTRTDLPDGLRVEIRDRFIARGTTKLFLAGYFPGEHASVVPQADRQVMSTAPPPQGANYLRHDANLLIDGDNVLISGEMSDRKATFYLQWLLEQEFGAASIPFDLMKVADRSKVQSLLKTGVKAIDLDVVDSSLAAHLMTSAQANQGGLRDLVKPVADFFAKDRDLRQLQGMDKLKGVLHLSYEGRGHTVEAHKEMARFAQRVMLEYDDGFKIQTKSGAKISPTDVAISKPVRLQKDGSSVSHKDCWAKLEEFHQELVDGGTLSEQ